MKRTYWKLFALLLAICMMVSCTPSVPEEPVDDTQPPIEQPVQPIEFSLTKDFVIVRPNVKQAQEVEALQLLGRGLQSANGIRFSKGTDYDENEYEILSFSSALHNLTVVSYAVSLVKLGINATFIIFTVIIYQDLHVKHLQQLKHQLRH